MHKQEKKLLKRLRKYFPNELHVVRDIATLTQLIFLIRYNKIDAIINRITVEELDYEFLFMELKK